MATQNEAIAPNHVASSQADGAARLSTRPQSSESLSGVYDAWLEQAIKVRDQALRLADERAGTDDRAPPGLAACNYLAESEKLFELTRRLVETRRAPRARVTDPS